VTPAELEVWRHTLEGWHDFFLLAGTAAVTLVGLLFVAISIHIDALVHPRREALLAVARAVLMSFVMVMVLSLAALMPVAGGRVLGIQCVALGVVGSVMTLLQVRQLGNHDHVHFTRLAARRRLLIPVIGYAWLVWGGIGLAGRDASAFSQVMFAVVLLLGNALGTSWDLLVRVARIKRDTAAD
jgi:hypothetical protein